MALALFLLFSHMEVTMAISDKIYWSNKMLQVEQRILTAHPEQLVALLSELQFYHSMYKACK